MTAALSAEAELRRAIPDRAARNAVLAFALRLRRHQDPSLRSARTLATTTALVLRSIVRAQPVLSSSPAYIEELVRALLVAGNYLQDAARSEQTIGNTVRRIVTILREEAVSAVQNAAAAGGTPGGAFFPAAVGSSSPAGGAGSMSRGRVNLLGGSGSLVTSPVATPAAAAVVQQIASPIESSSGHVSLAHSSTPSSAPGTGASTPFFAAHHLHHLHHPYHQHHSQQQPSSSSSQQQHASTLPPVRPGLTSLPSAFGSFSIADLVSVGSSQGVLSASSKLALSSLHSTDSSTGGGGGSLADSGVLTPERGGVFSPRRSSVPAAAAASGTTGAEDEEMTERQDADTIAEGEEDDRGPLRKGGVAGDPDAEDSDDQDKEEEGDDDADDDAGGDDEDEDGALGIKPLLIQAIQEYIDEIDSVPSSIAKDARDHIHSGETILTLGRSRTIEAFLKAAAAKDRHFTIIVPEGAPDYDGHHLARTLAHLLPPSNPVLLIPDSAVQALMPRISKVLLSAHSILPNGGILTRARGAGLASLAASETRTPVVVLAGVFKVCPDWSAIGDGGSFGSAGAGRGGGVGSPSSVLGQAGRGEGQLGRKINAFRRPSYETGFLSPTGSAGPIIGGLESSLHFDLQSKAGNLGTTAAAAAAGFASSTTPHSRASKPYAIPPVAPDALLPRSSTELPVDLWAHAEAYTPEWEYVDPARIDVLITNVGEHPPSYVYRLVKENYHMGE